MGDTVIGFDGAAAGADVTVIVLNRTDGGPWQLVDQQDRAELDAAAQDLVRRLMTENAPAPRPPVNPPLTELVSDWMARYTGPDAKPFVVDEEQLRAVAAQFGQLVRDGRLTHDHVR